MKQQSISKERIRSIENEKLGITKGYEKRYTYEGNDFIRVYFSKCGYLSGDYGQVYNHVNKCLVCKRFLGISKSQVKNRSEIVKYFLLGKKIDKYAIDEYGRLNTSNNYTIKEFLDNFSIEFKALQSYSNIVALRKGNVIYRNYEHTEMSRSGYFGGLTDTSYTTWNYKHEAERLGVFDLQICNIPLDTLSFQIKEYDHNAIIEDIEIIEPKQTKYIYSVGYDGIKIVEYYNDMILEDEFFKVVIRNKLTNEIYKRAFVWKWDETSMCLIEVDPNCKNLQEALLFLYPKEIKNRSGTLRQGEFFFEPTSLKVKPIKNQTKSEQYIINKQGSKSNHFGTYKTNIFADPYDYVSGTVRHSNSDHRMLRLKKNTWYRVHQSNALNSWSINLRNGARGD